MISNINIVLLALALVGTSIGTLTDLKTKLVPDWTNYLMIFAGLLGGGIIAVIEGSAWPFAGALIGATAFFGIGYLLYLGGVWAGGDVKLLTAFGAVFGPARAVAGWPFLVSLWLNILIFGAVFGIIGTLIMVFKKRRKAFPEIKSFFKKNKLLVYPILGILAALIVFKPSVSTMGIILVLLVLSTLLLLFKAVEPICFIKSVPPSKLVEGDWIAEPVRLKEFNYKPKRSGVAKGDIEKLVALEKSGKLKEVKIKDGIPYVPAFLAALLTTTFYGDLFWNFVFAVFNQV